MNDFLHLALLFEYSKFIKHCCQCFVLLYVPYITDIFIFSPQGGGPRRNTGQRGGGGNFGAHPGRGGAHRGMTTAFAQPTY